jgi:hypothetical protein
MSDAITRTCSRIGCEKTFNVTPRISRRQERRYCSDTCRVRDHRAGKTPQEPLRRPQMHVTAPSGSSGANEPLHPILSLINQESKQPLRMTFDGYAVVRDPDWPAMYRVRRPDGTLTDMANLTRARDAAQLFAEQDGRAWRIAA